MVAVTAVRSRGTGPGRVSRKAGSSVAWKRTSPAPLRAWSARTENAAEARQIPPLFGRLVPRPRGPPASWTTFFIRGVASRKALHRAGEIGGWSSSVYLTWTSPPSGSGNAKLRSTSSAHAATPWSGKVFVVTAGCTTEPRASIVKLRFTTPHSLESDRNASP